MQGKTATNAVGKSRAVKVLEKIGHKILDNMEEAIEAVVPEKHHKSKPRTKAGKVWNLKKKKKKNLIQ